MQLIHLAFKGSGHGPLAQSFDAVPLGLHQALPVITTPLFPDPSTQTSACDERRIAIREGIALAYPRILSQRNDGDGAPLNHRLIRRLCHTLHRPSGSQALHPPVTAAASQAKQQHR